VSERLSPKLLSVLISRLRLKFFYLSRAVFFSTGGFWMEKEGEIFLEAFCWLLWCKGVDIAQAYVSCR
jgi:hypothetical protein